MKNHLAHYQFGLPFTFYLSHLTINSLNLSLSLPESFVVCQRLKFSKIVNFLENFICCKRDSNKSIYWLAFRYKIVLANIKWRMHSNSIFINDSHAYSSTHIPDRGKCIQFSMLSNRHCFNIQKPLRFGFVVYSIFSALHSMNLRISFAKISAHCHSVCVCVLWLTN